MCDKVPNRIFGEALLNNDCYTLKYYSTFIINGYCVIKSFKTYSVTLGSLLRLEIGLFSGKCG